MGFLDDLVGIAGGLKQFTDEVQAIKDDVVSSFTDIGGDAKAAIDDTVQSVKDMNPLDESNNT